MFKPKFLKEAIMLQKGVKKFLRYKRDLISKPDLDEIERLSASFDEAVKNRDQKGCEEKAKKLTKKCEIAVPVYKASGMRENIEVVFVAVVIAVGIRAYFLQPFKIPTGSMQPTLNGIIAKESSGEEPGFIGQVWDFVKLGRNYVKVEIEEDGELIDLEESTTMKFFTHTKLKFRDQSKNFTVYATRQALVQGLGLGAYLHETASDKMRYDSQRARYIDNIGGGPANPLTGARPYPHPVTYQLKAGSVIAQGYVDTGDQVLVDKISYHFRKPSRGEVFVFRTTGIKGIENSETFNADEGSQHYIKRLGGVPDDELKIDEPNLLVNGERAKGSGFERVMNAVKGSGYHGYKLTSEGQRNHEPVLEDQEVSYGGKLKRKEQVYFALGDNSANSADSRSWGFVPEPNLVGPALLVYWPFSEHWGIID